MSLPGIKATNLPLTSFADSLLVVRGGGARQMDPAQLSAQLGAISGPTYETRAQLNADLAWAAGSVGKVVGDATLGNRGIYKKSGASGAGSWTRIGPLPEADAEGLAALVANGLVARPNLTTEDLDTITGFGVYLQGSDANATVARNYPEARAGTLVVETFGGYTLQEFTTIDGYKYWRRLISSVWGAWVNGAFVKAKVWNAIDPLTITEIGPHIVTNATNLPTGWPSVTGLTANVEVRQFGGFIQRFLRSNGTPEAEWRSVNGAAWKKSSAYQLDATQLGAAYAYRTLVNNPNFNTILDEGNYVLTGTYTNGPAGLLGGTALLDVKVYGNFRVQSLRSRTAMDRIYQRSAISTTFDAVWETIGGTIGGGTGFSIAGKTFAVIGDSIVEFGDWPERLAARFGMTVHKFGFGGCRMGYYPSSANGYDKMCMYNIAKNIASDDYSSLIAGAEWCRDNLSDDNTAQANAMAALDWSTVDYLLICFGTNDWTGNVGVNGTQAPDAAGASFDGALAYAIEQIQAAYPHLKIGVISPAFRVRNVSDPSVNSDNEVLAGLVLPDYVEACGKVAKKYHVPWYDFYNEAGINRYNFDLYLGDGTHPKPGDGYQFWAEKNGSWMGASF